MATGYITFLGKGEPEFSKPVKLRPYTDLAKALAAGEKSQADVYEVDCQNPDQYGRGDCTFVRKINQRETMKESTGITGLAFLVESDLEKAQVTIAAQSIVDDLQKMYSDLAKMEADNIIPIVDSMRVAFGPEEADRFNNMATEQVRTTMDAVKASQEALAQEVARLEGAVNGEPVNDMAAPTDGGMGDGGLGDLGGEEGLGDIAHDAGAEADAGDLGDLGAGAEGGDDLEAAFDDAAADTTAAGRAKKESVQRNVKALRESKNPDRLVFETFRRTLTEAKDAVRAAKAVAEAFAIDFTDVVAIIKEGKTFKDEKGKSKGNKDRRQDREDKKRDRPKFDEGKKPSFGGKQAAPFGKKKADSKAEPYDDRGDDDDRYKEVDEGKTFKDEKDKTNKNKDYGQARKDKKRDRPSDMDENLVEFEMKDTPEAKKGMFKGKTKAEIEKMKTEVKAKMKAHEDKGEKVPDALRTKFSEITFALRAKNDWGKAE